MPNSNVVHRTPRKVEIFFSHSTKDIRIVQEVADVLQSRFISTFVAHGALKISDKWRDQILVHLERAEALVVFLTKNFHASDWTDQEVGYFMQRENTLIICLRLGRRSPYGFLEQYQTVKLTGKSLSAIASSVLSAMVEDDALSGRAARRVVTGLCESNSYNQSIAYSEVLDKTPRISAADLNRIIQASLDNNQIANCQKAIRIIGRMVHANRKRISKNLLNKFTDFFLL
jgi:predicted transcriptional regulator